MSEVITSLMIAQIGPGIVLLAIIIFIVAAVAYYYRDSLRELYQERFGIPQKTVIQQQIENDVVRMRLLAREQNFKDATIVMWQTLQKAALGHLGIRRAPTQTPRQFIVQLISADPSATNLRSVVTLYERARYSDLPISGHEFNQALAAFHQFLTNIATTTAAAATSEGE